MFNPLNAGSTLAAIALVGCTLLGGCAARRESMEMPPPSAPPPQMEAYPGAPPPQGGLPPSQEPIMEQVAQRVIQHYQTASCQTLARERSQPPTGQRAQMEQRAVQALRGDPQLRTDFLNRVAAPVANRLFECGLIP
jgi:hypothetical protein